MVGIANASTPARRNWNANYRSWLATIAILAFPTLGAIAVGLTAQFGRVGFLAAGVLLVVALGVYLVALRDRPELLVGGLLIWLSVERFVVAAFAASLDPESLRLMLGYKELFFPLLGVVLLPSIPRVWRESPQQLRVVDCLALAFGILIIVAFVVGPAPLMERVIYARRLALLPLVYGVVRLLPWRLENLRAVTRMVVLVALGVAVFGLVERFVAESMIWREWVPAAYYYHLSSLAELSAQGTDFPLLGLPVTFWDFTGGTPERRLVSTFLEATTLSSFLAFGAIVAVATVRPLLLGILVGATIGLAGFLTLGKAGWLILGLGVGYVLVVTQVHRLRDPAWLGSMAAGVIIALAVVAVFLEASANPTGALAHFEGLRQGLHALADAPLGHGLGIGGNFGVGTAAAESTFGVIMVQIGVVGLAIWSAWILGVAYNCATIGGRVRSEPLLGLALAAASVAFFATAAYTESAGGYLGNWVYALLPAALMSVAAHETGPDLEPPAR